MSASAQVSRTWTGGNGDWFVASNWSPAGVPGPLDSVTVANGVPAANSAVDIANLTLSSGLTGTGTLTISGLFSWSGGTLAGTGTTIIAPGASMIATNQSVTLNSGRRLENHGTATVSRVINIWSPSTLVNAADGTLTISTDSDALGDAIKRASSASLPSPEFVNAGAMFKSSSAKTVIGTGVNFTNSGSVDIQGGTLWIAATGSSTGPMTTASGATLELRNYFDFPSGPGVSGPGTLNARGATVFALGTFHPGGAVTLWGSENTINDDWSPGAGVIQSVGGTVVMNGAFTYGDLDTGDGRWVQNGPFSVSSLSATVLGPTLNTNATIAHLNLTNGAKLAGTGTVVVTDSLLWTGPGALLGLTTLKLAAGAVANIPAGSYVRINGVFETSGTINLGGAIFVETTAPNSFVIQPGGVLNISTDMVTDGAALAGSTAGGTVVNYGTINKIGGVLTQFSEESGNTVLNNYGVVRVQNGTLDLHAPGTESGSVVVDPGATLILSSSRTRNASSTLTGAGSLRFERRSLAATNVFSAGMFGFTGGLTVAGGTVTFNTPVAPPSIAFSGGSTTFNDVFGWSGPLTIGSGATVSFAKAQVFSSLELNGALGGAGSVTINDSFVGGGMTGAGKTILGPGCVSAFTTCALDGRTVENSGTASVNGRIQLANGAAFLNKAGASLTVSTDATAVGSVFYKGSGTASIVNQGTLIKSAPVTTTIDTGVFVTNEGAVRVLQGTLTIMSPLGQIGSVDLSPGASLTLFGNYTINMPIVLSGGGRLQLLGTWTNNSTISVDSGFLSLAGKWTNAGTINVSNSDWWIDGTYTSLGAHTGSNNAITYLGTFPGAALVADASTGDISLRGFTANGTALKAIEGARFVVAATVNLNGCSLEGTLALERCSVINITAGLTLVNGATLRVRTGPCTGTALQFGGSVAQLLGGTGQILIEDTGTGTGINITTAPALTIGPNVSVRFGDGLPSVGNSTLVIGFLKLLVNQGSIESLAPGRTFSIQSNGSFTNQGLVGANGGNISVNPTTITNYASGAFSLTGGKWSATGGSLTLGSRSIRTIGANTEITLSGAANSIPNLSELSSNLGTLRVSGRTLGISPVGGTFAQSGLLDMGTGGRLQIAGAMTAGPASTLRVSVGGINPGDFGGVTATGAVGLSGVLRGAFAAPYAPVAGDVIPGVISSQAISGSFASVCFDENPDVLGVVPAIDVGSPNLLNLVVGSAGGTAPRILVQPGDSSSITNAVFEVVAAPTNLSYQWRRNASALADGPTGTGSVVSGSTEATLTIAGITAADVGIYDVVVSNSCGTLESAEASLRICPGDLNNDGFVDDSDFVLFLAGYNILDCADPSMPPMCPADLNQDAVVDDTDFQVFVGAYDELICP